MREILKLIGRGKKGHPERRKREGTHPPHNLSEKKGCSWEKAEKH